MQSQKKNSFSRRVYLGKFTRSPEYGVTPDMTAFSDDSVGIPVVVFFVAARSIILLHCQFCYSAPNRVAEYDDDRVCLCLFVCPRSYLRKCTSDLHRVFLSMLPNTYGSVLLWWRIDKLRTSGFVDDVTSTHKPRLIDVATQLRRSSRAALGLAINGA